MMEMIGRWLLTIIAVSLLCALADALTPRGAVKRVGKLVGGLVLLAAILSPAVRMDVSGGERWLAEYFASAELRRTELAEEVDRQMKIIIEAEYAAYIVDKAAELGAVCTARVECQEQDGLYLPTRAEVAGELNEAVHSSLFQIIQLDLGVPESQIYMYEEEVP